MNTCLRLTFFLCLLPMLTAAQPPPVQVVNPCLAGNPFTIRVPVRIPVGASGEYEWYRNDTLIAGTRAALTAGVTVVAYTVPADKARGDSVVFHFKYNAYEDGLDGSCGEWTASRKYAVTFYSDCSLDGTDSIEGDEIEVTDLNCQMSVAGSIEGDEVVVPDLTCQMSVAGNIEGDEVVTPDLGCQMSSAGGIDSD